MAEALPSLPIPSDWKTLSLAPKKLNVLHQGSQMGYYSLDKDRQTQPNVRSSLKVLKLPEKGEKNHMLNGTNGWDLHQGIEQFDKKDEFDLTDKTMKQFFHWLVHENNAAVLAEAKKRSDQSLIICDEKLLTDMALTVMDQFKPDSGWCNVIFKYKGIIFCQPFMTAKEETRKRQEQNDHHCQLMAYRGHKFRHCITMGSDQTKRKLNSVVSNKDVFVSLNNTQLSTHPLLVVGSFAAVDEHQKPVEIKCMVEKSRNRQRPRHSAEEAAHTNRVWLASWLKCKLLGMERIILGKHEIKEESCLIRSIKPRLLKDLCNDDEQTAMLCWLNQILNFMVENVQESERDEMKYYKMEWNQGDKRIQLESLSGGENDDLKLVTSEMLDAVL